MTRTLVLALTLLPFTAGCTTLQPLPDAQPATIRQAVEPGDRVELEKADGTRLSLKVEQVTETELVGVADGKRHTVALADVRSVNTRVMTTSDKVWTGVGVAVVVGAIIAAAGGGGSGGGDGGGGGY